ncbi:MAG TPA: AbiV family abortive infection protein [Streptosporangiaceae bacterium]|nr:AbiV family abortive infection protein [Streptosporangiaceae bacterium]
MDLAAVKDAPARELGRAAAAAARNAVSLADDAELLSVASRPARASSLAGLAVEEVGKAGALAVLAVMPENLRARAPVGRMLEWHQMKLVAGQLVAAVPFGAPPTLLNKLAAMSPAEIADILDNAQMIAVDVDQLKQLGLYVDVDRSGQIREPSRVTAAQLRGQLGLARQAASASDGLLDPTLTTWFEAPQAIAIEFSAALVSAFAETGHGRTPEAAAEVLLNAATKLQN